MKKFWKLAVTSLAVLCIAACQQNGKSADSSAEKDKITLAWGEDFGDVNPHVYNPDQFVIQDMVYEGLVRYGDNGKIEPALAESWKVSEDGKTYTFNLRKAKFSDGSDFNAANVKRNFDTIFSKENKGNHEWFNFTNVLDSYKVVDDHTFEITLKEPYSATLYDLSMIRPIRFLADASFPDGDDTTKNKIKSSIGTGQWVVKEKKSNEYITFTRNENYWGEKPKLKEVTIKIIPDAQTRALEFESGKVDLLYGNGVIGLDTFAQYKKDKKYTTDVSQPMSSRLLLLNAKQDVFQDKNVRKAINHAVNKKEIAEKLFMGAETPADTIFSKSTPHSDAGLKPYKFDIKEAKLTAKEEDDYWENAKTGNFDMMLTFSWGAPWDPHAWMTALTAESAHGHPENVSLEALPIKKELDETIKQTLTEADEEKVDAGYKKALTMLHEEAVYIPLTYQSVVSVYRTGELKNVRFAPEENALPVRYIEKVNK